MGSSPLRAVLTLASLTFAAPLAQAQQDASQSPSATKVEEVVVTAQKRSERLQDVPISVSVVTPDQLSTANLTDTRDLQYLVPSVEVNEAAGPRSFGVFIRGLGTTNFATQSIEPSSAYVVDGVIYGQAGAAFQDMPDVRQIEVLKGPQGTLVGKNASVGVINITTRDPSQIFEADAHLSYAEPYNDRRADVFVTGPITDDLAFTLSGRVDQRDGMVTNVFDGRKFNNKNDYGFRGKLKWTPDDDTSLVLSADYFDRHSHCCIATLTATGPTPTSFEQIAIKAGVVPGPNNLSVDIDGDVLSNEKSYGTGLQIDRNLGAGYTLTSITAYRRWWTYDGQDSDGTPQNLLDFNYANYWQDQTTQEVRIASPTGGFVDYVAGLYYFYQGVTYTGIQLNNFTPASGFSNHIVAGTTDKAIFGQANFHLGDFTLIAGARELVDDYTADRFRFNPVVPTVPSVSNSASKSVTGNVFRFGGEYHFDSDHMLFATFTHGFKGGGFDTNPTINTLPSVNPETPLDWEAGFRTFWPDQHVTFNATAFDTVIKNYQAAATEINPGTLSGVTTIVNVARLETKGVEFTLDWRPLQSDDLGLFLDGAYDDARYDDYPQAPCYTGQTAALGCVTGTIPGTTTAQKFQNLSGMVLGHAPLWNINLDATDRWPLSNSGFYAEVNANLNFQSSQYAANAVINPSYLSPARALINVNLGITPEDARWKVAVYIRNLTDVHFTDAIGPDLLGTPLQAFTAYPSYEARRIVGINLNYRFGG